MMRFKLSCLRDGTEILQRLFLEHKGALEVSNVFSVTVLFIWLASTAVSLGISLGNTVSQALATPR